MKNLDKDVFEETSQFIINNQSKEFLKTIVFWVKFISMVGLIAATLVFFGSICSVINRDASLGQVFTMWFLSLFTFIPLIYLFKFSQKLKESLITSDEVILQKAIQNLKSYFKTIAISMVVVFLFFFTTTLSVFIFDFFK